VVASTVDRRLIASERDRSDVMGHRHNFQIARRFVDSGRFVFLDESGAKIGMTRLYGRSPGGERCVDKTPHGRWETITMISAIQGTSVLENATPALDGPIDGPTFLSYVEDCLVPALKPGRIVVMDNLSAPEPSTRWSMPSATPCVPWPLTNASIISSPADTSINHAMCSSPTFALC